MSQQMNQANWNGFIGNASTASTIITFAAPVAQWRLKNLGSVTAYYDFTGTAISSGNISGPQVGTVESSGIVNGQGAIVQNLALWSTSTGAPGQQIIFNGFII